MKRNFKRLISAATAAAVLTAGTVWLPNLDETRLMATTVYAEGEELTYGNYKYKVLDDNNVEITGWIGDEREINVDIPAQIDGKQVYSIGENAFSGKTILSLKLSDGLVEIKYGAFSQCCNIAVEIPESVTTLNCSFDSYMGDKPKYVALPNNLNLSGTYFPVYKYHSENDNMIIDEINNSAYMQNTVFVPAEICGKSVNKIDSATGNTTRAIVCPDSVSVSEQIDKIVVKYSPEAAETCSITSVTGNASNMVFGLAGDVDGRKITSISGVKANLQGIAVPKELAGSLNVDYPVLLCDDRSEFIDIVGVNLNGQSSVNITDYCGIADLYNVFMPQGSNEITFSNSVQSNIITYTETENGIEITGIEDRSYKSFFIPTAIDDIPVTSISEDCISTLKQKSAFVPSSIDISGMGSINNTLFTYAESPNGTVSITGNVSDSMFATGTVDLEKVFGKPIDTYISRDNLSYANTENNNINVIKYKKNQ